MKILFVIDRVELKYFEFNDLVTNFWLIKEFLLRGNEVFITTIDKLSLKSGIACAFGYNVFVDGKEICFDKNSELEQKIENFQLVMFRPDPPVDLDYINATYVMDFVNRDKTVVLNDTKAIRDFNEKLHALYFRDLMPENIVTASKKDIVSFLKEHNEIVLKPLNACFGAGVMYLKHGDKNTVPVINSVTNKETNLVMVQKYLPTATSGDKRVLILGDKVLDWCVRKLPSNGDFKFNDHCDQNIVRDCLSSSEKVKFTELAQKLNQKGIFMAGLDVVDEKILEINVTSPCYFIKEINNAFGIELEKIVADFIISHVDDKLYSKQAC